MSAKKKKTLILNAAKLIAAATVPEPQWATVSPEMLKADGHWWDRDEYDYEGDSDAAP